MVRGKLDSSRAGWICKDTFNGMPWGSALAPVQDNILIKRQNEDAANTLLERQANTPA